MNYLVFNYLIVICITQIKAFDPFSIGSGLAALGGAAVYLVKDNMYCKLTECCSPNEIPANYAKLEELFDKKLFGQHIAKDIVLNSIKAHWDNNDNAKALTLSFHGWPGSGKNYVAGFIKDSLYAKGSQSTHVHHFMGRVTFPLESHVHQYKENLYNWIKGNVTRCPRQLFIFDEVDKIPTGVLNILKPIIDYNENVENVDYRQSIFIFLSNTGSKLIVEEMLKLWNNGINRDAVKLSNFEKIISRGAFNEIGGFQNSDTIRSNLIDHYIPFLPMERSHVRKCILEEFSARNVAPQEEHIQEVMEFVEFGPTNEKIYSLTGCKRLSQKVAMVIQQYGLRKRN